MPLISPLGDSTPTSAASPTTMLGFILLGAYALAGAALVPHRPGAALRRATPPVRPALLSTESEAVPEDVSAGLSREMREIGAPALVGLAIDPLGTTPWRARLRAHAQLDQPAIAIAAGETLLRLDPPDRAAIHHQLATLL